MIVVDFIIDGVTFATRDWGAIPRVGDTVILADGKMWAEVIKIIWANDSMASPSLKNKAQWVQVVCKKIEDPTKP